MSNIAITLSAEVKSAIMNGVSKIDGFSKTKRGDLGVEFDSFRISSTPSRLFSQVDLKVEFLNKGIVVGVTQVEANVAIGDVVSIAGVDGLLKLNIA